MVTQSSSATVRRLRPASLKKQVSGQPEDILLLTARDQSALSERSQPQPVCHWYCRSTMARLRRSVNSGLALATASAGFQRTVNECSVRAPRRDSLCSTAAGMLTAARMPSNVNSFML